MKKIYSKPTTEQFRLNMNTAMLAGSELSFSNDNQTGSSSLFSDDTPNEDAWAKEGSLWD
ncbi:MAG: hypothetical protein IJ539_03605 [Prevotella sp.]|nr:hypothetical protein [Prevotella sp.]MBQ9533809.1 hypothetical protein [Prevotella sp.]